MTESADATIRTNPCGSQEDMHMHLQRAGLACSLLLVLHATAAARDEAQTPRARRPSDPIVFLRTGSVQLDRPPDNWCGRKAGTCHQHDSTEPVRQGDTPLS